MPNLTGNETREQLLAMIAEMEKAQAHKLSCKVSKKGGVSVYGMGRWPVTLYKSQWKSLIAFIPQIEAFLKSNDSELKAKPVADDDSPAAS